MCAFIVNPPIRDDADYYRRDDHVVDQILAGAGKLVIGLRRSGKTSFLYRVQRAARARQLSCEYLDLGDLRDEACEEEIERLAAAPAPDVLLLDEAEVWHDWDRALLERFVRVIRRSRVVVVTCAPEFVLDLHGEPPAVQRLVEELDRHVIGPLSDDEARDLLAQAKRPPGPLTERQVEAGLERNERLAIVLQAVGSQFAGKDDVAVSLGGFGKRILTGLTDAARAILVDAAHGSPVPDGPETALLIATGALRRTADGPAEIASDLLAELIRTASPRPGRPAPPTWPPPVARSAPPTQPSPGPAVLPSASPAVPPSASPAIALAAPPATVTAMDPATAVPHAEPRWERHARILHLSDLHFGHHAIDSPKVQARRLIQALERDDRIPDFIAVTGDLSWSGHRTELRDAETFLDLLVVWLRQRRGWDDLECRRRIIVVPGNHEAAWALSGGIRAPAGASLEEAIEHWARYSLGPFANFVNRFYRRSTFWDLDTPCVAATFGEPSIAFVSMSTAHYITEASRHAKFGQHLLEQAVALLALEEVQRARFRIGVWHHNLRPFHNEVGAISDVDLAVRNFLRAKPGLDLALHGHVHQGEVEIFLPRGSGRGGPTLLYSAVGSFGVAAHHRPGDDVRGRIHNELAVIELSTSGAGRRMVTEFYELKPDANAQWTWVHARTIDPQPL